MNKLRIYLILAILIVGLIPKPDRLLGKEREGCRQYVSAFISIQWEYNTCAWGPWPGTFIINIPGFLTTSENLATQVLPNGIIVLAPTESNEWLVWDRIRQPYLWREKATIKNLDFHLLPEVNVVWCSDYDSLDCYK